MGVLTCNVDVEGVVTATGWFLWFIRLAYPQRDVLLKSCRLLVAVVNNIRHNRIQEFGIPARGWCEVKTESQTKLQCSAVAL